MTSLTDGGWSAASNRDLALALAEDAGMVKVAAEMMLRDAIPDGGQRLGLANAYAFRITEAAKRLLAMDELSRDGDQSERRSGD